MVEVGERVEVQLKVWVEVQLKVRVYLDVRIEVQFHVRVRMEMRVEVMEVRVEVMVMVEVGGEGRGAVGGERRSYDEGRSWRSGLGWSEVRYECGQRLEMSVVRGCR